MYEVYWMNYEGRDNEAEEIFNTVEEAETYVEENSVDCSSEEGYIIHDVKADRWFC